MFKLSKFFFNCNFCEVDLVVSGIRFKRRFFLNVFSEERYVMRIVLKKVLRNNQVFVILKINAVFKKLDSGFKNYRFTQIILTFTLNLNKHKQQKYFLKTLPFSKQHT